jgi:flagellar hook-associated protein 3 FlgL
LALGTVAGNELSIRNQMSLLNAMVDSNSLVGTRLTATQTALDAMRSGAQGMLQSLASGTASDSAIGTLGQSALGALSGALNITVAGEYIFGGINTGAPPFVDFGAASGSAAKAAIDVTFATAFGMKPTDATASSISGARMAEYLDGTFATQFNDTNWMANWSTASSVNKTANIAPGSNISVSTNANEPGARKLAQAYAMLTTLGGATLGAEARQTVVSRASSLIQSGISDLTSAQATMRAAQARVADSTNEVVATIAMLQTRQNSLDGVDQYKAATTVNELTTQIQTAYQLTAQLQKLSLAQYLPT